MENYTEEMYYQEMIKEQLGRLIHNNENILHEVEELNNLY